MSFDDDALVETRAKQDSESIPAPQQTTLSDSVDVRALAEAVMVMLDSVEGTHRATTQILNQLKQSQAAVASAPQLLRQGVEKGIQVSLSNIDAKEKALVQRSITIDRRGRHWLLGTLVSGVVLGGLLIGSSLLWLGPQIKQYQHYQNTHEAVAQESLFGAQFRENAEGEQFIVFDDNVRISQCSVPNCVGISR